MIDTSILNGKTYIILDFDETLFKLNLPWDIGRSELAKRLERLFGQPIPDPYPGGTVKLIDEMYRTHGDAARSIIREYSIIFEEQYLTHTEVNNELIEFVKTNRNNFIWFIWSSNTQKIIDRMLKQFDIFDIFRTIVTIDTADFIKPNPSGFDKIYLPETKLVDYILIGDSKYDQRAAASAHIDSHLLASTIWSPVKN